MVSVVRLFEEGMKESVVCTEPAAIGLAVSATFDALKNKIPDLSSEDVEEIVVKTDRDVYKNSLQAGISYKLKLRGPNYAAALGIFCDPSRELSLFQNLTLEKALKAKKLVHKVKIVPNYEWEELHIEARVTAKNHMGIAHVVGGHSNISYIEIDGKILLKKKDENVEASEFKKWDELACFIEEIEHLPTEAKKSIRRAMEVNYRAFLKAEKHTRQKGYGSLFKRLVEQRGSTQDCINQAKMMVSTAIEARMVGLNIKVMTCAGSGNMGLVATLPLRAIAERFGQNREKLVRAAALAQLVATYVSEYSGKLSALCGCCTKAGVGLAAGVAYYLLEENNTREQKVKIIGSAINNLAGNITGMICDGAKSGCALKAATATGVGIESALLALMDVEIPLNEGIVDKNPMLTLRNIGKVSEGMVETDKKIIKEILEQR